VSDGDRLPGPSWYDVLDVAPTATAEEIRTTWRAAIADLTPADRRFRVYNQAAEVLLDPERRAAHDAELREQAREQEREEGERETPAPPAATTAPPPPTDDPADGPAAEPVAPAADEGASGRSGPRVVPGWLLAGVAVLTAAALGVLAYLLTQPSPDAVEEATARARDAAERAIVPVLSYDYRSLEQDQAAAHDYVTSDYQEEYDRFFEGVVAENAERTKAVVDVQVVASAVVRGGVDRSEILLFLDRPTTNASTEDPVVYRDQVRVRMERVDDQWLVDCLITSPDGRCD